MLFSPVHGVLAPKDLAEWIPRGQAAGAAPASSPSNLYILEGAGCPGRVTDAGRRVAESGTWVTIRARHVGLELPHRQGHLERHLLSELPTRAPYRKAAASFDGFRFYAEHFDTVEINSTFYGVPAPATARELGGAHTGGFEFSLKLYPEIHAPRHVPQDDRTGIPWSLGRRKTSISSGRRSIPWRTRERLARSSRSFPRASRTSPIRAPLPRVAAGAPPAATQLPSSCVIEAGAINPGRRRSRCSTRSAGRWAQIDEPKFRVLDPAGPVAEHAHLLLPAAARPECRPSGGSPRSQRTATTTSTPPPSCSRSPQAAKAASREVKKAYLLCEQSFLGENGRHGRHPQGRPRPAAPRRDYPPEMVERYPDLKGLVKLLPARARSGQPS